MTLAFMLPALWEVASQAHARGDLQTAARCYRQIVTHDPTHAAALHGLGRIAWGQGRLPLARVYLTQALSCQPDAPLTHLTLGEIEYACGHLDAAQAHFQQALRCAPDLAEAHTDLGVVLQAQGALSAARAHYEAALHCRPDLIEAHVNLGVVLQQQGELPAARAHLETALRLAPDLAEAHTNLGVILQEQGEFTAARAHHEMALRLRPGYPEAWLNLGTVLRTQGDVAAAAHAYETAIRRRPDCAAAHYNLGLVRQGQGHLTAAVTAYEATVALQPHHSAAYYNLGVARQALGDGPGAVAAYQAALRLQPDCAKTRWSLALSWLAQGNLAEGWAAYEWRWHTLQELQPPAVPRWDGSALTGRTILVTTEQGVGDELLFASCLPDLLTQAGHVVLACDPRLLPLFARSWPGATVRGMVQPDFQWLEHLPPLDVYMPLGSLPRYLRPTLASFPPQAGYLRPDPARQVQYQQRLATLGPGRKVGIAWRSLRARSDPTHYPALDQWQALLQVPGVHWINLQYDNPSAELAAVQRQCGVTIHTWDDLDLLHDLDGVAALMAALELVIAPDTTVAALAGSLGRPVWRLMVAGGSWDMLGTDGCPWFPSMRIVCQQQRGQWADVLARVADEVAQCAGGR